MAFNKARKMLQEEDPRFKNMDRMLARAFITLQRQRIQQKRAGIFTPRYVHVTFSVSVQR